MPNSCRCNVSRISLSRGIFVAVSVSFLLFAAFTTAGIVVTAQASNVPNVAGTWTGPYYNAGVQEYYSTVLTLTQNGSQVQGTHEWTTTQSPDPQHVGQKATYSFTGTFDASGALNARISLLNGPSYFNTESSAVLHVSADGNTMSTSDGTFTFQRTTRPAQPTQQPTATPFATPPPVATVSPTPTIEQRVSNGTIINLFGNGTITWGTNPATGDPMVTLQQQPAPGKQRTTTIDFAPDPTKNTANYNGAVQSAQANGYTPTAQGERTYVDPSQNYRYSNFSKGADALSLQAIGSNSTNRLSNIPGDILLTQSDQTFNQGEGGLFGLSQLATWVLFIIIGVAILALIIFAVWYRRRKRRTQDQ